MSMTSMYFRSVSGSIRAIHTIRSVHFARFARFAGVPGWRPVVLPWRAVIPSSPPAEPDSPALPDERTGPGTPVLPPDGVAPGVDDPLRGVVQKPVREPPAAPASMVAEDEPESGARPTPDSGMSGSGLPGTRARGS